MNGPYTTSGIGGFREIAFTTFVTQPTLSVGPGQVVEGNAGTTNLVFPVTLSPPARAPVTAPYTLANGTATGGAACTAGVDFINTGGTVTIPAGSTTGTITVPVWGETLVEPDETLTVTLGTPTNAVLGTASATGTILNDDATAPAAPAAPTAADLTITKTGPTGASRGSNVSYTIAVTNNGGQPASNVSVQDPTPTGLTFVSNGGACTTSFPCQIGTVGAGETKVITATFGVPSGYSGPDPIVNVARVGSSSAEASVRNNEATARTPVAPSYVTPPEDNQDKPRHLTEEQRQDQQLTNNSNRDDIHTEGTVVGDPERAADGSYLLVTIALGPGGRERLTVQVFCPHQLCPDIRDGDQVEADGYQNGVGDPNNWFVAADGVEVTRNGKKVK